MRRVARILPLTLLALTALAGAGEAGQGFARGEAVVLQRLSREPAVTTNLALVSFSGIGNQCVVALRDDSGALAATPVTVTLEPFEERPYLDVFAGLPPQTTGVSAVVSCRQPFTTFAILDYGRGAPMETIRPVKSLEAARFLGATVTAPAVACPAGATCFDVPGVVLVPSPSRPVARVTFPAPAGAVKRLRLTLDVTVGSWDAQEPSAKPLIYRFVVNKSSDLPGQLNFLGPGRNQALALHGLQLAHPRKITKPFIAEVGHTYQVDNDYDLANRKYTVTITDVATGRVRAVLAGQPNLLTYTVKPASKLIVQMGFEPGSVPHDPPIGWRFSNLKIKIDR